MNLIAPPRAGAGRWVVVPDRAEFRQKAALSRTLRRRKHVLIALLVGVLATGILAVLSRGSSVEIHLLTDAVTLFYVATLIELKRRRSERELKVRPIRSRVDVEELSFYQPVQAFGGRRR